jgi:YD repeat-containing protein
MADSLRTRRLASAQACLEALGRQGGVEAVPLLSKVLAVEKGELAVSAAKALGWTDVPAAEGPLIAALSCGQPELRAAAARALGHVGTVDALLPLRQMEAQHWRDGAFRNAARQAVADIQSRLTGAAAGQLSLSEDEGGRLSLTRDESGRSQWWRLRQRRRRAIRRRAGPKGPRSRTETRDGRGRPSRVIGPFSEGGSR